MNILKRFTPVTLSALLVFSAGVSSIAHAVTYSASFETANLIYVANSDTGEVIRFVKDGGTWYDGEGNDYEETKRGISRIVMTRVEYDNDIGISKNPQVEVVFIMRTGKKARVFTDGTRASHLEVNSVSDYNNP